MVAQIFRFELFANVRRDAHDVIHHRVGILEDISVNLLMDVTNARSALAVSRGIGLVDVTDFKGFGVENFAVNLKFLRDLLKLLFLVRHSGFKVEFMMTRTCSESNEEMV